MSYFNPFEKLNDSMQRAVSAIINHNTQLTMLAMNAAERVLCKAGVDFSLAEKQMTRTSSGFLSMLPKYANLKDGQQIILRRFRYSDIKEIERLMLSLDSDDRYTRFQGTLSNTAVSQHCHSVLKNKSFVAETRDKELIGLVELGVSSDKSNAELSVVVNKKYSNKGVGYLLTTYVLDQCDNQGIQVHIVTLMSNRRAISLASKLGFSLVREGTEFFGSRPVKDITPATAVSNFLKLPVVHFIV